MVVTRLAATSAMGTLQERVDSPSISTVHAPHNDIPQPNFVPVRLSTSRRTQSRGIWGSPLKVVALPLTENVMAGIQFLLDARLLLGAGIVDRVNSGRDPQAMHFRQNER